MPRSYKWIGYGLSLDGNLCVGWFYAHRFAMLINRFSFTAQRGWPPSSWRSPTKWSAVASATSLKMATWQYGLRQDCRLIVESPWRQKWSTKKDQQENQPFRLSHRHPVFCNGLRFRSTKIFLMLDVKTFQFDPFCINSIYFLWLWIFFGADCDNIRTSRKCSWQCCTY